MIFFLIHDDIIDKSNTRRGKPSLHKVFDKFLAKHNNIKFNGQDLAIVAADIIYALAIKSFLSIKENSNRKEKALQRFIKATVHTGCGEFIELLSGIKNIEEIEKKEYLQNLRLQNCSLYFCLPPFNGCNFSWDLSKVKSISFLNLVFILEELFK